MHQLSINCSLLFLTDSHNKNSPSFDFMKSSYGKYVNIFILCSRQGKTRIVLKRYYTFKFTHRLHDTIQENPEYAGYIIPPPPPRPDFDASREKLRKLGDAEGKKLFTRKRRYSYCKWVIINY